MNVIVSNKQKRVIDNANIDCIKDLSGVFRIEEIINNFKNYFYSKMIIDATSIVDFSRGEVLEKMANGIGGEKIILLLPEKPVPPRKFLAKLVSLGIYNFTTNINDVLSMLQSPKGYDQVKSYVENNEEFNYNLDEDESNNNSFISDISNRLVIGFKNVTEHAGSTTLIYAIKKQLESAYQLNPIAYEINKNDFVYYRDNDMYSVDSMNIESEISKQISPIILVDLNDSNYEGICDKVVYLVEPSIIKINKLLVSNKQAFTLLKDKIVVLNKSPLTEEEVMTFEREAGIDLFYSIPFINERKNNDILKDFLFKLGILENNM